MIGHVKWYSPVKCFGFIRNDESEIDYFFHSSDLNYGFVPINGTMVEFEPKEGERGLKAVNVRAIDKKEDD